MSCYRLRMVPVRGSSPKGRTPRARWSRDDHLDARLGPGAARARAARRPRRRARCRHRAPRRDRRASGRAIRHRATRGPHAHDDGGRQARGVAARGRARPRRRARRARPARPADGRGHPATGRRRAPRGRARRARDRIGELDDLRIRDDARRRALAPGRAGRRPRRRRARLSRGATAVLRLPARVGCDRGPSRGTARRARALARVARGRVERAARPLLGGAGTLDRGLYAEPRGRDRRVHRRVRRPRPGGQRQRAHRRRQRLERLDTDRHRGSCCAARRPRAHRARAGGGALARPQRRARSRRAATCCASSTTMRAPVPAGSSTCGSRSAIPAS